MDNTRVLAEWLHNDHMGRDSDPVRGVDGGAVVGESGDAVSADRHEIMTWWIISVTVCLVGGFVMGWMVGAWLAMTL